jgi:hypothetical protein
MNARNHDPTGRVIGGILALGGLWHTMGPWVLGFSEVRTATGNAVAAGLTMAVFGILPAVGAGVWAIAICGLVGLWILLAPQVFGYAGPGPAADESLWVGLIVSVLVMFDMVVRPALATSRGKTIPAAG